MSALGYVRYVAGGRHSFSRARDLDRDDASRRSSPWAHLLHGCEYRSLTLIDPVALAPWGSPFVHHAVMPLYTDPWTGATVE